MLLRAGGRYTGLRLLAFLGCFVVLSAFGVPKLPAVAGGLLLSSVLSLVLLRRQRDELVVALEQRRAVKAAEKDRLRSMLDEGREQSGA